MNRSLKTLFLFNGIFVFAEGLLGPLYALYVEGFDKSILAAEAPEFIEHRTEQAIMTSLAHKYGLKLYREACEAGNKYSFDKELYSQLFTQFNPTDLFGGEKVTLRPVGSKFANVK